MSVGDQEHESALAERAMRVYDAHLKAKLEQDHLGKVIGLEPESGEYVIGEHYVDVCRECHERFPGKQVYCFRVGGGGAAQIGWRLRHARPA